MPTLDIIGVNNRNLKNFWSKFRLQQTISLTNTVWICENFQSGISNWSYNWIKTLWIPRVSNRENFMKTENAGKAATEFISKLN
jgi:indole-3-glycerol phosphate synthase